MLGTDGFVVEKEGAVGGVESALEMARTHQTP
jgi:hypothetical protein